MENINARLLESEMVKNGVTIKEISNELNIAETTFYRKLNGVSDFYRREIAKIVEILKLTREDTDKIFFKNVFA